MKRFIRIAVLLCGVAVLLGVLSFKVVEAKAATSSQSRVSSNACGNWTVVPSPGPANTSSGLDGVAAVSASNVWAVGGSGSQLGLGLTLIEHWQGSTWKIVTSPSPSSIFNHLYAVTTVSANDVWAVGFDVNSSQATQTLVEHWNGTSWSVVKSPSPGSINNQLFSVAAVSASDVWAVGFTATNTTQHTLIEHWNGTSWTVVKSPSPSSNDVLTGVAAVSANDVWAVGAGNTMSGTLTEHWNGTSWSIVKSPSPGSSSDLVDVAAVSSGDVWAVGYALKGSSIVTLIENWNGTSWQVIKSANVGMHPALNAVAAVSSSDVWAVGSNGNSTVFDKPLTEQWNGTQWSIVKSPSPGSFSTQLVAVTAISATNVWAVGGADSSPLIEHFHC
jgi:hypothetical protein